MLNPFVTLRDGKTGKVKAVYEVVAFVHPVTGRWLDGRDPADYDGKDAMPNCDICNRNAKRFDEYSSYCRQHWPIGEWAVEAS